MSNPRKPAPFGRRELTVVDVRQHGDYFVVTIDDPEAPAPRAGQFHMVAGADGWGAGEDGRPWLARAISFLSVGAGGRVEFLIDPVGPGTANLCCLKAGDRVLVTGPFGNGFSDVEPGRRPLLVGGGIGAAPVLAQAQALDRDGMDFDLILGFRGSAQAAIAAQWSAAVVTTDDGSAGEQGTVIEPMRRLAAPDSLVMACGPPAMLEAVRGFCVESELECELALEAPMACGFGACFGCAVETGSGTIRLCVEGPVIDGRSLTAVTATGRRTEG